MFATKKKISLRKNRTVRIGQKFQVSQLIQISMAFTWPYKNNVVGLELCHYSTRPPKLLPVCSFLQILTLGAMSDESQTCLVSTSYLFRYVQKNHYLNNQERTQSFRPLSLSLISKWFYDHDKYYIVFLLAFPLRLFKKQPMVWEHQIWDCSNPSKQHAWECLRRNERIV